VCSDLAPPAVDEQFGARELAGIIGGEERHGLCDLIAPAHSPLLRHAVALGRSDLTSLRVRARPS
jgi:hypothetical protein